MEIIFHAELGNNQHIWVLDVIMSVDKIVLCTRYF